MVDNIEKWIGGIIISILSSYKIYHWWKGRKERRSERKVKAFVKSTEECKKIIRALSFYVPRIYLFRGHNGGGEPRLGSPYYVDVVDRKYENPNLDKSDRYSALEVDSSYRKMLLELLEKGPIQINTDELEEGLLKQIYQNEGVVFGKVYKLYTAQKDFFFMSCTWFTQPKDYEIFEADMAANRIRSVFKKHYE